MLSIWSGPNFVVWEWVKILIVEYFALLIVKMCSKFQVNIFNNDRDMLKFVVPTPTMTTPES